MNHKLQLAYVLTSSPDDVYLEQAYVSMCSAKHYMPDAKIILITDDLTANTLKGTRKQEIKYADQIIVVKILAQLNGQKRSRYLKTNVRKYLKGDFLFIDCDTIITKPLYDILNTHADIAACHDSHCSNFKESPYYEINVRKGKKLHWPIEQEKHYFNTGILFVRDTPPAHKFYNTWHHTLIAESWPKNITFDQPSFAKTNYMLGHIVKNLPDVWNCELKHGIKYLKDAKIVHYLCTNMKPSAYKPFFIMIDQQTIQEIKQTGNIPPAVKETITDPFRGIAPLSRCFAGDDLYFFTTALYHFIRKRYGKPSFRTLTLLIHLYNRTIGLITETKNK